MRNRYLKDLKFKVLKSLKTKKKSKKAEDTCSEEGKKFHDPVETKPKVAETKNEADENCKSHYLHKDRKVLTVKEHKKQYLERKKKLDAKWEDIYYFQKLQEDIILTKLSITKYNYSLDDEV